MLVAVTAIWRRADERLAGNGTLEISNEKIM